MFVPHQLLYFTGLRCCCVCPTPIALFHRFIVCLSHFTGLRCCCVCPTSIALFDRFKMLCLYTTLVWFHRLKMLLCLSHTNCFISQVEDIVVFSPHQLLYVKGLRCCCVCPTPIALFHRFKMLLCLYRSIVWFHRLKMLLCFYTSIVWFHRLKMLLLCPTPIALFHRFKMLLCLSHTNCFISQV